jgi:aryl-alcohol dehydrogenase-like predicted oxidoreductase
MNKIMPYKNIPYVKIPLSKIVFGTAIPAMQNNEDPFELLDAVYQSGINVFDSAASYKDAEASLGRWIESRNLRDCVVILTKGANPNKYRNRLTEYDIMSDIEDSFAKLKTDYIDIYILHRDDPSKPVGAIVELLNKLHEEGRIGAFGGSNWTLKRILEANDYAKKHQLIPFTVCSPSYSLAECIGDPWGGSITISGNQNKDYRNWLLQNNFPVFCYSGLARGFLSGKLKSTDSYRAKEIIGYAADEYSYPINYEKLKRAEILAEKKHTGVSQIALSWLMHQPLNIFALTSPSSVKHLNNTLESLFIGLTDAEQKWLNLETNTAPEAE